MYTNISSNYKNGIEISAKKITSTEFQTDFVL